MTTQTVSLPQYYYDLNSTREDLMGDNQLQDSLIRYLVPVLERLFKVEGWYIACNLNIYRTLNRKEPPITPDIAVFIGVVLAEEPGDFVRSWSLALPGHSPPSVVFEMASEKTWRKDVKLKPGRYARIGVPEHIFYDPRPGRYTSHPRLRGWHTIDGEAHEMVCDERGWLWNGELESWLAPDGKFLRLYDRTGNLRLTGEETERAAKERAWAKLRELGIEPEAIYPA